MKSLAQIWKAVGEGGGQVYRADVAGLSDADLEVLCDLAAVATDLAQTETRGRAHERKVAAARAAAEDEDLSPEEREAARRLLWEFGLGEKP